MFRSRHRHQLARTAPLRLLVVLLAWSQVSLAAHQFEHSIDDVAESCNVCLQFERYDDVVTIAECQVSIPAASHAVAAHAPAAFHASAFTPYLSRASP